MALAEVARPNSAHWGPQSHPPETFDIIKYSHSEKVMWEHAVHTWLFRKYTSEVGVYTCGAIAEPFWAVPFVGDIQTNEYYQKQEPTFKWNLLFIPVSNSTRICTRPNARTGSRVTDETFPQNGHLRTTTMKSLLFSLTVQSICFMFRDREFIWMPLAALAFGLLVLQLKRLQENSQKSHHFTTQNIQSWPE